MLRHILFDVAFFPNEAERASSQKRVLALLQALTYCNQLYLREHPETPLIYKSGIVYKVPEQFEKAELPEVAVLRDYLRRAPKRVTDAFDALANMCGAGEHFREIPRIIENGGGDCDNVSCWRSAELRELGINARPYITWRRRADGGMTYHVIVEYPDGSSEDPSLLLGMGGADRAADRAEEERKLAERTADVLSGDLRSTFGRGHSIETVFGVAISSPQDYSQLQYSIPFQTDDSYEAWSPTRPQAYYADPRYASGLIRQSGPLFNTRLRDPDEMDWEDKGDGDDRFDGLRKLVRGMTGRRLRSLSRRRAA